MRILSLWLVLVPIATTADHGYLRSLLQDSFGNATNSTNATVIPTNTSIGESTSNIDTANACGASVCTSDQVCCGDRYCARINEVCVVSSLIKAPTLAPTLFPPPPNNDCTNSISLGWSGEPMQGTTIGATPDMGLEFCGGVVRSGSVWYSVMGTGAKMVASTCFEATEQDTQIAVYSGHDCNRLICVGGNDDVAGMGCPNKPFASRVVWESTPGILYYILVYGFRELGNFEINAQVLL
jgi:hypothetical protein